MFCGLLVPLVEGFREDKSSRLGEDVCASRSVFNAEGLTRRMWSHSLAAQCFMCRGGFTVLRTFRRGRGEQIHVESCVDNVIPKNAKNSLCLL